jgi:hypothetical protein
MLSPNSNEPKRQGIAILICVCSGIAGAGLVASNMASPFIVLCALSVIWEEVANWTGRRPRLWRKTMREIFIKFRNGEMRLQGLARAISMGSSVLFAAAIGSLFVTFR